MARRTEARVKDSARRRFSARLPPELDRQLKEANRDLKDQQLIVGLVRWWVRQTPSVRAFAVGQTDGPTPEELDRFLRSEARAGPSVKPKAKDGAR
jgi:hypothetical protein